MGVSLSAVPIEGQASTPVGLSRTRRFAWAALLTWTYQALVLLVGLWLTRFLLGHLGERTLGWWAQSIAVVGYIALADFGLSALLPRDVAAAIGRAGGWRGAADLPGIIASYVRFSIWQLLPVALLALGCGWVLSREDGVPTSLTIALVAMTAAVFPLRLGSAILTGLQDVRFMGIAQIVMYLSGVIAIIISITLGLGPVALLIGWMAQAVLLPVALWGRLLVSYRPLLPGVASVAAAPLPLDIVSKGTWSWLSGVGIALAATIELLAIAWFDAPETVFRFACTTKVMVLITPIIHTLCQSVLPGMAELRASGDSIAIRRVTTAYTEIILAASGLFGVVVLATNAGFVSWWVGPDKYLGDNVMVLAVIGMNLRHWLNAAAVTAFCLDHDRRLWQLTFLDGLISAAATIAIVRWGGPTLAPLGPLLAVSVVTLPALLWLIFSDGTLNGVRMLLSIGVWATAYVLLAILAYALGRTLRPSTSLSLAAVGSVVAVAYVLLIGFLGRWSAARRYLWS